MSTKQVRVISIILNLIMIFAMFFGPLAQSTVLAANASASLDQCGNDPAPSLHTDGCNTAATQWENGNLGASKSVYIEGDSIPYRMLFDNLDTGITHTVTIEWDTTKSSKHAIDYLTTFNQTVADANPCLGVSACSASTTFGIPTDPQVTGGGVTPIAGAFTLYGGTITSVSAYSYTNGTGFVGDMSARITLNFTTTVVNPVLAWGGHIATRHDWGQNNSAISISGSPYHTRLIDLDGSGGNQDRSLSAEAVIFPASITIIKDATPNGSTSFPFTASPSPLVGFSLVDDGTPANYTKLFSNITNFTSYAVTENTPAGWSLTGISCSVIDPNGGSQNVSGSTATINLKEGENVTCTFSNLRNTGDLKIIKAFDPLTSGFTGTFAINYDCNDGTAHDGTVNLAAGAFATVTGIPTGTQCTVSEPAVPTAPTGWTFGAPSISPAQPVTINSTTIPVEVTVTNSITRDQGYLKLSKVFDPLTSGFTGAFAIVYNCGAGNQTVNLTAGSSTTVGPFNTGTSCSVSEPVLPTAPAGWTFGTPVVTGSPATIVKGDAAAAVEVSVTNSITRDLGNLKISKTVSNPDGATLPATFAVNYDCGGTYTGQVSVAYPTPGFITVSGIPTGSVCSVTEVAPSPITGFTWGTITYTPASVTITAKDGTYEIVVGNSITRDRGSLKIIKSFDPLTSGFVGTFAINYDCDDGTAHDGTVNLAAGAFATISGIPTGTQCTVSEPALPTAPTGWTFGAPSISPAQPVTINSTTVAVEVTVTNSITRDLGNLKITKTVSNPDGATLPATFVVNYDCGGAYTGQVSVAYPSPGFITVPNIPTGSVCTVTEVAPTPITGFTWGTITYTPASITIDTKDGTFEIVVGNSITRDLGNLKITKTVSNPDGASLPATFAVNYDCGIGYTGQVSVAYPSPGFITVTGIPTGSTCSVTEVAPTPITGFTWGTITYTPASISIDTKGGTFEIVVGNSITRDLGNLKITKTVSNPDGATLPATFAVNYDCGVGYTGQVSVAYPTPGFITVPGIPTGSTCSVTEVAPTPITGFTWGTITYTPASISIDTKDGTFEIVVGNSITRDRGSLTIIKSFDPLTSGFVGNFTINYDCDDGTAHDGTLNLAAGGSSTFSGIPTGTQCTVSEPALPTAPTGWTFGAPSISPAQPVTINSTTVAVEVTVTNSITRDQGYLKLSKVFDPLTSGFTGTFAIIYNCGAGDQTTYLNAGGWIVVGPFDTGTSCAVSEPVLPTAPTGWTFGVPSIATSPATIVKGDQAAAVEVIVTNSITRDLGNLKITKTVSNPDGATLPATFVVNYDCGGTYTGQVSVAYPTPGFITVPDIPTGSVCSLTEVAPTPITDFTWGSISYTPATVTISDKGGTFEIVVGNSITRDRGNLKITKTVSNPDGATLPATFAVNYDCGGTYNGQVSVAYPTPGFITVSGIPTGSVCSVTEVAPTPITGYTWGTITYTPASITIDTKDGTFEILVGNSITRDLGNLKITKTVSNPDGATLPATFAVNYDCGGAYTGQVSVAYPSPGFITVPNIPTGSVCTVTEVAPTPITGYTWGTITYTPASITIDTKDGTFEIVVGNSITRDLGNLKITKTVSNPDGASLPATFVVNYDCGIGYTGQVSVAYPSPGFITVTGIPTGSTCTVTEVAPTPITGFTWGTITYTPASISIDTKGGTFEIVVGNSITRDHGYLKLSKVFDPLTSGFTGTFAIVYNCGAGDQTTYLNAGGWIVVGPFDTGTSCTVSEPVMPNAPTGWVFDVPLIETSPAIIVKGGQAEAVEVTVTNYIVEEKAALLPTQTTCQMYAAGPSAWPPMYDAFSYMVKDGMINSLSPGVIFYYNTITAPSTNFTFDVVQNNTLHWKPMLFQTMGQAILYDANCNKTSSAQVSASITPVTNTYTITFNVTGVTSGATYYIGIKYSPQNLVGQAVSASGGVFPTSDYSFYTAFNNIMQLGSDVSIPVRPKK